MAKSGPIQRAVLKSHRHSRHSRHWRHPAFYASPNVCIHDTVGHQRERVVHNFSLSRTKNRTSSSNNVTSFSVMILDRGVFSSIFVFRHAHQHPSMSLELLAPLALHPEDLSAAILTESAIDSSSLASCHFHQTPRDCRRPIQPPVSRATTLPPPPPDAAFALAPDATPHGGGVFTSGGLGRAAACFSRHTHTQVLDGVHVRDSSHSQHGDLPLPMLQALFAPFTRHIMLLVRYDRYDPTR